MIRYGAITPEIVDAALVEVARHVPGEVTVGVPFAARIVFNDDGSRAIGLHTRQGGWVVTTASVQRIRRLDSELAEMWDTSPPGRFDFTTWVHGRQTEHVERTVGPLGDLG